MQTPNERTPERGYEYFPRCESDDGEVVSHLFDYLVTAEQEWPRFRRELEAAGEKSRADQIDANVISVFTEARDAIIGAFFRDDWETLRSPQLRDRLTHAFAFLAMYGDTPGLPAYFTMILPNRNDLPESRQPEVHDFMSALFGGDWNQPSNRMPADVTLHEAVQNRRARERAGVRNSGYDQRHRLDAVARAARLNRSGKQPKKLEELYSRDRVRTELRQLYPRGAVISRTFSVDQLRRKLVSFGKRKGLKQHATFFAKRVLGEVRRKDNPSAWRAIDRKWPELQSSLHHQFVGPG